MKFDPLSKNPTEKSKRRHMLREIDKRQPHIIGAKHKALEHLSENEKLWKRFPEGPTAKNRGVLQHENAEHYRKTMKPFNKRFYHPKKHE